MSLSVHAATRIMCLGDSITQGMHYDGARFDRSYRYELWKLLVDNHHDFDLVGARDFPADTYGTGIVVSPSPTDLAMMYPDFKGKSFDGGHEAAWGNTTGSFIRGGYGLPSLDDRLASLSAEEHPDLVLVHLGSNDPGRKMTPAQTTDNLATIIGKIRGLNPNVRIMLAQLIPRLDDAAKKEGVTDINKVIPALATSLNTANSPVTVVDFRTALTSIDLVDNVHPNLSGEAKMAAHWYAAISNDVNRMGVIANVAPTAVITADNTSGIIPLAVVFSGSASSDSDGTVDRYAWDFDDGSTSTDESPSHTYANSGAYTATLTVTDEDGVSGMASVLIVVAQDAAGPDGLILQYKFNETNGILAEDSSVNTYTGSVGEGMNWSAGKFGNAAEFSGGKIEIPVGVFNQITRNQMTICMWVYDDGAAPGDPSGQAMIYGWLADEDHYYQIGSWNGYLAVKLSGQSCDYAGFTKADFCGAWNHWAFVRDANANTLTVYRNGVQFNQAHKTGDLIAPDAFILGQRMDGSNRFTGKMDDFRIYKTALSTGEILSIMTREDG